jgi:hypothetical protein
MRRVLSLLLTLSVAACGPPLRWMKPGVDDQATTNDLTDCRRLARNEAMRDFPFYYPWAFPLGRAYYWSSAELDRSYAESRLTSFCMRTKGYALVEVRPETTAPPPPSPTEQK